MVTIGFHCTGISIYETPEGLRGLENVIRALIDIAVSSKWIKKNFFFVEPAFEFAQMSPYIHVKESYPGMCTNIMRF